MIRTSLIVQSALVRNASRSSSRGISVLPSRPAFPHDDDNNADPHPHPPPPTEFPSGGPIHQHRYNLPHYQQQRSKSTLTSAAAEAMEEDDTATVPKGNTAEGRSRAQSSPPVLPSSFRRNRRRPKASSGSDHGNHNTAGGDGGGGGGGGNRSPPRRNSPRNSGNRKNNRGKHDGKPTSLTDWLDRRRQRYSSPPPGRRNDPPPRSNRRPRPPSSPPPEKNGIERLREAFQQSLEIDRARRFQRDDDDNDNNDGGGGGGGGDNESRLDRLLRTSARTAPSSSSLLPDIRGVGGGGGAKAFRERRRLVERLQEKANRKQAEHGRFTRGAGGRKHGPPSQPPRPSPRDTAGKAMGDMLRENKYAVLNRSEGVVKGGEEGEGERVRYLPNRRVLSFRELSGLLRVPKRELQRTVFALMGGSGSGAGKKSKQDDEEEEDYKQMKKIDIDMAELVALELGFDPKRRSSGGKVVREMEEAERRVLRGVRLDGDEDEDDDEDDEEEDLCDIPVRPPVVCVMGHVDHGKTTLMDALRRRAAELTLAAGGNAAINHNANQSKKAKKKKNKKKKNAKSGSTSNNHHNGDIIRNVAGTEAGGITQAISSFQVQLGINSDTDTASPSVTFLDTPGHAAFQSMRRSGSHGADVIVLVIAVDDGVSPQTVEILQTYKDIARSQPGSISLVVAMTKVDTLGGDEVLLEERTVAIENQLIQEGIYTERVVAQGAGGEGGGEFGAVQMVGVSGVTGEGVEELVEGLALQSEVMDLRADVEGRAEGLVIDSKMEKGVGVVVDCIVRSGTLRPGDYVLSGVSGGKLRILNSVDNKPLKEAGPSQPVRLIGLKTLPTAGDPIVCVQSEDIAKLIIQRRENLLGTDSDLTNSHRADASDAQLDVQITGIASKNASMGQDLLRKYGRASTDENDDDDDDAEIRIPILLKADADGTLAALRDSVIAISDESRCNLCIDPIALGIGPVTVSDVRLARDSGATILCFNIKGGVGADRVAMDMAADEGVDVRSDDVIYRLLDGAKDAFSSYFPPVETEIVHGNGLVKAVFDVNNKKNAERIAGLQVMDGLLWKDKVADGGSGRGDGKGGLVCEYRVKREGEAISPEGLRANSLRRVKEDVDSVHRGDECGLGLTNYMDLKEGDIIECFSREMKRIFV